MRDRRGSTAAVFLSLSFANAACVGFTLGTYVLFLKDLGLTPLEINLVNGVFYIGRFFLEVLTGAIADVFGRKASSVTSFVLYAIGLFLYWDATTFIGCAIAEFVLAVGSTCLSGAFDAWVTDELRQQGAASADIHRLFAREAVLDRVGMIAAAPVGGLAAHTFGMATPWLLAAIGMSVLSVLGIMLMHESRVIVRASRPHKAIADTARRSFAYAIAAGPVRAFLIASACCAFGAMAPNMQWAPFFENAVGGSRGTGIMFALISVVLMIGSGLAPWLLWRTRHEWAALAVSLLMAGIGVACVPLVGFPFSLAPFALYELAAGAFSPLKKASLSNAIDTDDRATVLSCDEMMSKLGGALGLCVTGALAQFASPSAAWICGGIAFVLGAAFAAAQPRPHRT